MKAIFRICTIGIFLFCGIQSALAQKQVPFQGKLLQNNTEVNGTVNLDFSISVPGFSWSESHTDITVTNGYYSVVLGSITDLPDNLFKSFDELPLNITVDGNAVGSSKIYAPLLDPTINTTDLSFLSPTGKQVTQIKGSSNLGGRFSTFQYSGDAMTSSIVIGHQSTGLGFINGFGANKSGTSNVKLIDLFMTGNDRFGNSFPDGYKRSGVDFYDNEGTELAFIGGQKDASGGGKSGQVILFGNNNSGQRTANVLLTGQNETGKGALPTLYMYGQNTDGGPWFMSNIELGTQDLSGNTGARFSLSNTETGIANTTILLESFSGTNGGSKMELRDNTDATQITLDGGNGAITAVSVTQSSDMRLKKNIRQLNNATNNIKKLRGVSYQWKQGSTKPQIGFIAQEVEEVYPELVHTDAEGMKSVNYAQMNAAVVEAIKELDQRLSHLESENERLKAENKQLNKKLARSTKKGLFHWAKKKEKANNNVLSLK